MPVNSLYPKLDNVELELGERRMNSTVDQKEDDILTIFDNHCNPDGKLPVAQFARIVEIYRETLSESTIRKLLDYGDKNKDGFISKTEIWQLSNEDTSVIQRKANVRASELTAFKRGVGFAGRIVLLKKEDQQIYEEQYSCCPPAIFIALISLVQLGVFIYYGVLYDQWFSYPPQLIDSPLIFDLRRREEAWRFISYMLLHADLEHIAVNVVLQLAIGIPLEMVHGPLRILPIYLAGVLAGSFASAVFDPRVVLVGASGGVYALMSAHLANVILNGDIMNRVVGIIRAVFVFSILGADFGYSIYRRVKEDDYTSNVSFVAHVAGAIAGLSMGLIALMNFKKSLTDKVVFWIAVAVYCAFMVFGIFWIIFYIPGVFNT